MKKGDPGRFWENTKKWLIFAKQCQKSGKFIKIAKNKGIHSKNGHILFLALGM